MYAAEMARYADKVIAFEANPLVAAFIAEVAPRNVEVINAALSSASGRATLRIPHSKGRRSVNSPPSRLAIRCMRAQARVWRSI
jgi:hypothetical protein